MNEGYIKLYRKFTTWEWYDDINTSRLFLHLLFTVNWQDKKWHGIEVKRGSVITSLSKLSEETGLTVKQVRKSLERLIETNEITKETTNRYTLISIVKYADYQFNEKEAGKQKDKLEDTQKANEGQSKGNQRATTKELKEFKELKNNNLLKENKQINNQELPPDLFEIFETEFKRPLSQFELQRLSDWSREYDQQLIVYSLREASINNAYSFNYIDKILCEWQRKGMTAEKYEEEVYAN
ncbi:MAG TPA: hypothetical protein DCM01_07500 [Dielma fastidiosa]|jgi:DnaD/phage-associated family protein|nr:hypothetical protein [Dielma fastidiosa]